MTTTDIDKMTQEQKRAAIAEAMGWKVRGYPNDQEVYGPNGESEYPDPFTDANDLRAVRDFAWEEHAIQLEVETSLHVIRANCFIGAYKKYNEVHTEAVVPHDGSRESRHAAEADAIISAVLKAIQTKGPTHDAT